MRLFLIAMAVLFVGRVVYTSQVDTLPLPVDSQVSTVEDAPSVVLPSPCDKWLERPDTQVTSEAVNVANITCVVID